MVAKLERLGSTDYPCGRFRHAGRVIVSSTACWIRASAINHGRGSLARSADFTEGDRFSAADVWVVRVVLVPAAVLPSA